jgi:hypothetical protein
MVNPEQLTFAPDFRGRIEDDQPAARLLRAVVAHGLALECVPAAAALVVELEHLAVEEREEEADDE